MLKQIEALQRIFAQSLDAEQRSILPLLQAPPCHDAARHTDLLNQRFEFYRSGIRAHWRAALAAAYPVLLAQVGEGYFDELAIAYAQAHPSQSGDLNRFGAALPAFMETYETNPHSRYFADLARLEWSLHVAYFAADTEVLAREAWLAMRPEELLDAKFTVHPACALIRSPYAIADIWTAHQTNAAIPAEIDSPTWALVVRPAWRPAILGQCAAAHAAFGALQRRATLNEALDAAFTINAGFDFTSHWRAWIEAAAITGLVRRVDEPQSTHDLKP